MLTSVRVRKKSDFIAEVRSIRVKDWLERRSHHGVRNFRGITPGRRLKLSKVSGNGCCSTYVSNSEREKCNFDIKDINHRSPKVIMRLYIDAVT